MTGPGAVPAAGPAARPDLRWRTTGQAVLIICRGRTFAAVWRIAVVVGTLLTVVNQAAVLLSGHVAAVTAARVAANYVIPYTVSSLGLLRAYRVTNDPASPDPADRAGADLEEIP